MSGHWMSRLRVDWDEEFDEFTTRYFDQFRDRSLASLPYSEYLETRHWRRIRLRALLRSGGFCQQCWRQSQPLEVHHLSYDRLGCEEERDLQPLCEGCHILVHRRNAT